MLLLRLTGENAYLMQEQKKQKLLPAHQSTPVPTLASRYETSFVKHVDGYLVK